MVVTRAQSWFTQRYQQQTFSLGQPNNKLHCVLLAGYRLAAVVHHADPVPLTIRADRDDLELGEAR